MRHLTPDINDDLFVKLLNIKVGYFGHLQELDNMNFKNIGFRM